MIAEPIAPPKPMDARTRALLHGPIVPLLLRMAWPNVLIMFAQAATGLIETYWVGRLGTDALAGMALVFPGVMLMQMISAGAMGGGISSAIARALGAGKRDDADALVLHAIVINVALGATFAALVLGFGRPLYSLLGGQGASLEAALTYSNVVFGGNVLLWVMNGLASVIRGTGNMLVPALVICAGALALVPLSPLLIFGFGPIPPLGIAGGGLALLLFYLGGTAVLGWYVLSGRNIARLKLAPLRWVHAREILNVGAGERKQGLRIAWIGAGIAFVLCETIGVAAALYPAAWLRLFDSDPAMLETGSAYLRAVGPFYGFFGFGLALYFASQGAGKLLWPLLVGLARMVVAIGGGWLALRLTGSLTWTFVAVGMALFVYGAGIAIAIK